MDRAPGVWAKGRADDLGLQPLLRRRNPSLK
jgi:hypothetical protein